MSEICPYARGLEYQARLALGNTLSVVYRGNHDKIPAGEYEGVSGCLQGACNVQVCAREVIERLRYSRANLRLPSKEVVIEWSGTCQQYIDTQKASE